MLLYDRKLSRSINFVFSTPPIVIFKKKVEEKKICQFEAGVCWKEKKKIEVWQNPERRSGRSLCNQ